MDTRHFELHFPEKALKLGHRKFLAGAVVPDRWRNDHFRIDDVEVVITRKGPHAVQLHCSVHGTEACYHAAAVMFQWQTPAISLQNAPDRSTQLPVARINRIMRSETGAKRIDSLTEVLKSDKRQGLSRIVMVAAAAALHQHDSLLNRFIEACWKKLQSVPSFSLAQEDAWFDALSWYIKRRSASTEVLATRLLPYYLSRTANRLHLNRLKEIAGDLADGATGVNWKTVIVAQLRATEDSLGRKKAINIKSAEEVLARLWLSPKKVSDTLSSAVITLLEQPRGLSSLEAVEKIHSLAINRGWKKIADASLETLLTLSVGIRDQDWRALKKEHSTHETEKIVQKVTSKLPPAAASEKLLYAYAALRKPGRVAELAGSDHIRFSQLHEVVTKFRLRGQDLERVYHQKGEKELERLKNKDQGLLIRKKMAAFEAS